MPTNHGKQHMNEILNRLDAATDDDLMMSRKNCHAKNLHSIVLKKRKDGSLLRCFLANRKHPLFHNISLFGLWSIGVHDHRYSISLRCVTGSVRNVNFVPAKSGIPVREYSYESLLRKGAGAIPVGNTHLRMLAAELLGTNNLRLHHSQIHTIYVPLNTSASWIVEEGPTVKQKTRLFSARNIHVPKYQTFTDPDSVRAFVREFFEGDK